MLIIVVFGLEDVEAELVVDLTVKWVVVVCFVVALVDGSVFVVILVVLFLVVAVAVVVGMQKDELLLGVVFVEQHAPKKTVVVSGRPASTPGGMQDSTAGLPSKTSVRRTTSPIKAPLAMAVIWLSSRSKVPSADRSTKNPGLTTAICFLDSPRV